MEQGNKTPRRSDGRAKVYRQQAITAVIWSVFVALCVLFFVFYVWLRPVRIVGDSMAPGLESGEIVLADRLAKYVKTPNRGDVVLFSDDGELMLKRIIALGGETVELVEGRVYIDSRPLEELGYSVAYAGDYGKTVIPEGSVFVLGDNRAVLGDSRSPDIGAVSYGEILGVLRFCIYPIDKFAFYY